MQVFGINVELDTLVLGLLDQLLRKLTSIERSLKARVCEILLEDHLVEGLLKHGVHRQVGTLLLEVVLGTVLKFNEQAHNLSF